MLSELLPATRRIPAVLTLCVFCAASIWAQTKPNFSGTWKELQPSSPGYSHTEKIQHQDPSLKVVIETQSTGGRLGSGLYMDRTYTIGGKKEVKKGDDGIIRSVSAKWEGATLVFLRTEKEGANTTTTREVWSLSEDGKTLTKTRRITNWRGSKDEKTVFEKQ
jgi:hypothetical protein